MWHETQPLSIDRRVWEFPSRRYSRPPTTSISGSSSQRLPSLLAQKRCERWARCIRSCAACYVPRHSPGCDDCLLRLVPYPSLNPDLLRPNRSLASSSQPGFARPDSQELPPHRSSTLSAASIRGLNLLLSANNDALAAGRRESRSRGRRCGRWGRRDRRRLLR
jgi:hypothetical protein